MKKITLSICLILAVASMSFASNSPLNNFSDKNVLKNIQLENTNSFNIKFNTENSCTVTWSYGGVNYSTASYSTCAGAMEAFNAWRRFNM